MTGPQPGAPPVRETKEWLAARDGYRLHLQASVRASEATVRSYLANVSLFARWCESERVPLIAASKEAVARHIAWCHENKASATAANRMLSLRNFYRWAVGEGLRKDDPTEGMKPKRGKAEPRRPYDDAELRALLSACLTQRDRALILTLLASGLRRNELVALTTEDIDWNSGVIRVRKGKGDKQRNVAISLAIISEIKSYLGERTGPIWLSTTGSPMTGHQVYQAIRYVAGRAGVTGAGIHRFRATFANRFLQDGGDLGALQSVLGHSEPKQTLHYAAYSQQERALAVQRRQRFAGLVAGEATTEEATAKQEQALKVDAVRVSYSLNREQMGTLKLLSRGPTTTELGEKLGISRAGAWNRIDTLLRRFGASTATEACVKAAQAGLLDDVFAEEDEAAAKEKKQAAVRQRVTETRRKRAGRRRTKSTLTLIKGGRD